MTLGQALNLVAFQSYPGDAFPLQTTPLAPVGRRGSLRKWCVQGAEQSPKPTAVGREWLVHGADQRAADPQLW